MTRNPVAVAMRRRYPRSQPMRDRRQRRAKDARRSWRAELDDYPWPYTVADSDPLDPEMRAAVDGLRSL